MKRRHSPRRFVRRRCQLTVEMILRWADDWFHHKGRWPHVKSGPIPGTADEVWANVDVSLRVGNRGLAPGSSLARLLALHRGVRNRKALPELTIEGILAWADAFHRATGAWPKYEAGPVAEAPGETWNAIETALREGRRGLPGGSSLARLLHERRGVRNQQDLPRFTQKQVLAWADAHRDRTGAWPTRRSGPIPEAPGETWHAVDTALTSGVRGFPGGSSLPRLLARHRRTRNPKGLPPLSVPMILEWIDAHRRRTGAWPTRKSGPIPNAPGETWMTVDTALRTGIRELPIQSSLARLLARRRGVRNRMDLPRLTEAEILAWAEAFRQRTGSWPSKTSGPIPEAPGTAWSAVDAALYNGRRGLPGGTTLRRFLEQRGRRG